MLKQQIHESISKNNPINVQDLVENILEGRDSIEEKYD